MADSWFDLQIISPYGFFMAESLTILNFNLRSSERRRLFRRRGICDNLATGKSKGIKCAPLRDVCFSHRLRCWRQAQLLFMRRIMRAPCPRIRPPCKCRLRHWCLALTVHLHTIVFIIHYEHLLMTALAIPASRSFSFLHIAPQEATRLIQFAKSTKNA